MTFRLQPPIIHWAGLAVRIFHVYFGNLSVVTYHIQRAMSQQGLQGKDVAARTQVGDGKGVAKFVRVDVVDLCPFPQAPDQDAQAVAVERPVAGADEKRGLRVVPILSGREVTPDGFSSNLSQESCAPFAAFSPAADPMPDVNFPGFQIQIPNRQGTKLGGPQSGIQQGQDDGLVAVSTGAAHHKFSTLFRLSLARIDAGFDHLFDIFFGKGLDGVLRELGWADLRSRVGQLKFFIQPRVKRTQGNINIAQGFSRKGFCISIPAFRFVFGTHPGRVIGEIGRFNLANPLVPNMVHPLVQIVYIGVNRALA